MGSWVTVGLAKRLRECIKMMKKSPQRITYNVLPCDIGDLSVLVYSDSNFCKQPRSFSQLGTLSFLVAKPKGTPEGASGAWDQEPSHVGGLFLEHSSRRGPRVCISTFGAETLAGAKVCHVGQHWTGVMHHVDGRLCFLPQVRTGANPLFTALRKLTSRPQEVNPLPLLGQFRGDVYCGRVGVA